MADILTVITLANRVLNQCDTHCMNFFLSLYRNVHLELSLHESIQMFILLQYIFFCLYQLLKEIPGSLAAKYAPSCLLRSQRLLLNAEQVV